LNCCAGWWPWTRLWTAVQGDDLELDFELLCRVMTLCLSQRSSSRRWGRVAESTTTRWPSVCWKPSRYSEIFTVWNH